MLGDVLQTVRKTKEFIQDLAQRIESLNQGRAKGVAETHNETFSYRKTGSTWRPGEVAEDEHQPVSELVEDGDDVENVDDDGNPAEMVDVEAEGMPMTK